MIPKPTLNGYVTYFSSHFSLFLQLLIVFDKQGFCCRHIVNNFEYFVYKTQIYFLTFVFKKRMWYTCKFAISNFSVLSCLSISITKYYCLKDCIVLSLYISIIFLRQSEYQGYDSLNIQIECSKNMLVRTHTLGNLF